MNRYRAGLLVLILIQMVTHISVFSISAHSGQLAIPYMMNQGRTLFDDVLEQHAPATSVITAFFQRILPVEAVTVALGLHLVLISLLIILVFVTATRLSLRREFAGLIAAIMWFWWLPVYGNIMFYFDTVLALFVCIGTFLILTGQSRAQTRYLFIAGICFGAATLAKQHGLASIVFALIWIGLFHRRGLLSFVAGVGILPLITLLVVTANGTLSSYIYWNWTFNLTGVMDGQFADGDFVRKVILSNIFMPPFMIAAVLHRRKDWLLIALMSAATMATMIPRFGIIHVTAHLPMSMIAGGVLFAEALPMSLQPRRLFQRLKVDTAKLVLAGVVVSILMAWAWTGIAPYFPDALGRGSIPAYDEFDQLTGDLLEIADAGNTLYVLPETDSTPQLHVTTGMLPPGLWVKGWSWYFDAPGITDALLDEWSGTPPDFVVVFPEMLIDGQPGIQVLVDFVEENYRLAQTTEDVTFHGNALIYEWDD